MVVLRESTLSELGIWNIFIEEVIYSYVIYEYERIFYPTDTPFEDVPMVAIQDCNPFQNIS